MTDITVPAPKTWAEIDRLLHAGQRVQAHLRVPDGHALLTFDVTDIDEDWMTIRFVSGREFRSIDKRFTVEPFAPAEFLAALTQLDMTQAQFARIAGVEPGTIQQWLGTHPPQKPIPPSIRTICALLTLKGARPLAEAVADAVVGRRTREAAE